MLLQENVRTRDTLNTFGACAANVRGKSWHMPNCPHCNKEISAGTLSERFSAKPYRQCPFCGGRFTVDERTRRRQGVAALLAVVSFGLTLAMLFEGVRWLPLASLCYCALALVIDMTERGSRFLPFE